MPLLWHWQYRWKVSVTNFKGLAASPYGSIMESIQTIARLAEHYLAVLKDTEATVVGPRAGSTIRLDCHVAGRWGCWPVSSARSRPLPASPTGRLQEEWRRVWCFRCSWEQTVRLCWQTSITISYQIIVCACIQMPRYVNATVFWCRSQRGEKLDMDQERYTHE